MKILITGCRGFVGGSLGHSAVQAGHEVYGIARSGQPDITWTSRYAQADVAHADLSGLIREYAPDVVFHGAGTASVGASLAAPLDDLRAATMTWANTLDSVRRSGLRPLVVFPSSAAIYGNPAALPVSEDAVVAPVSPYGFHKAACELIAKEYAECFGLPVLVCRLFSLFGPAQRRLLVWELYTQIVGPEPVVQLQGLGTETRDYLGIEDVCAAILELAENRLAQVDSSGFTMVNIGSSQESKIMDLAQMLLDVKDSQKEITCRGLQRPGDPLRWCADTATLRRLAPGWVPHPLRERLLECVSQWQQN